MPDNGQENLTESAMSTFLKSVASGAGKMATNALTLGGAKAFETDRNQKAQTQATMKQSLEDRASLGYMPEAEDYRNWKNAGGDDAAVAAIAAKAHAVGAERVSAIEQLEALHQRGIMNDQEYSMHAMALYSDDPTAGAMAKLGISKQAQLAGIQLKGAFAEDITKQKEEGAQKRTGEQIQSREGIAERAQSGAMAREKSKEDAAGRLAKIHAFGKANGLAATQMKNMANAADVVGAATGDPGAMKKVLGPSATEPMSPEQAKAAFGIANSKLASTKGMSLVRMATKGAMMLSTEDTSSMWEKSNAKQAHGVGITALIEDASKNEMGGITPEIAAKFRSTWAAGLAEKDPNKQAEMLKDAIQMLPDPTIRDQIMAQLGDMNDALSSSQAAEEVEGDEAMGMLNSPDTGDMNSSDEGNPNVDPHYDIEGGGMDVKP